MRVARRATYREIASFCGVSPQNVQRWKAGGTIMPEHIGKLARFFNTSVDYIMNGHPGPERADSVAENQTPYAPPCPMCPEYRREIEWLRSTISSLQDNFAAALAAIEKKGKPQ